LFFYRLRSNYPSEGMNGDDAGKIATNYGSCKYETAPTPPTEIQANNLTITQTMALEAKQFASKNWVIIRQCNNIDLLSGVAAQGKAVPIMIYATYSEWAQEYPKVVDKVKASTAPIRHEVCILPHSGFIENGKKYVTIQDSAWFGDINIRYLSEDFIKNRVFYAKYFLNLQNPQPAMGEKPHHVFMKTMQWGDKNDEVLWLQKCLIWESLLSPDCGTGFFGGLTYQAVCKFQMKYANDILKPAGFTQPTGIAAFFTLSKLNELYGK